VRGGGDPGLRGGDAGDQELGDTLEADVIDAAVASDPPSDPASGAPLVSALIHIEVRVRALTSCAPRPSASGLQPPQ
jgi:hypothetical protein